MIETILSGVFGGVLRLAPELFKFLDAKNERKHELDMQEKALEFQKLKGDQVVDEISVKGKADFDMGALNALTEAIKGQETPSGVKWIDGLSKLIRPLITLQWVILLYPGILIATFYVYVAHSMPVLDALGKVFGPDEKAIVSFIIDFWFIGRVLERNRK